MIFKIWLKKLLKYISEIDMRADRISIALERQKEHDLCHHSAIYF